MFKENENRVKEVRIVSMNNTEPIFYENVKIWTCESHVPMLVVDFGTGKTVFNLNNIASYSFVYKEDE